MRRVGTSKRFRRLGRDERGAALAELAILLPFLIIMLAAVAELGRFFQAQSALTKSTRAAARHLSRVAYDEAEGKSVDAAKNIALCGKTDCAGTDPVARNLELADIVVAREEGGAGGNPVRVTVSVEGYDFEPFFDLGALLNNHDFTLALPVNASTTMYYMWNEAAGAGE